MKLAAALHRSIALKSNRSENPAVQINIKLTQCTKLSSIFDIINQSPLSYSQSCFALRIFSRIIHAHSETIATLPTFNYPDLLLKIERGLHDVKSLEFCDLLFWLRTTQMYGVDNLSVDGFKIIENKLNDKIMLGSLTLRQAIGTFYDSICMGIHSEPLNELVAAKLSPDTPKEDIRHIINSIKSSRMIYDREFMDKIYDKVRQSFSDPSNPSKHYMEIIRSLGIIGNYKGHYEEIIQELIKKVEDCLGLWGENDIFLFFRINKESNLFPKALENKVLEKLAKNLELNPKRLSNVFISTAFVMFASENPEYAHVYSLLIKEVRNRVVNKEFELSNLGRLCSNLFGNDKGLEEISELLSPGLLHYLARRNILDVLLYKSKQSKTSNFEDFRVEESGFQSYINYKGIKTSMVSYSKMNPEINEDFNRVHKAYQEKVIRFIERSKFNAKNAMVYITDYESGKQEIKEMQIFKDTIGKVVSEDEYSLHNLSILTRLSGNYDNFMRFLGKHHKQVDLDKYSAIIMNNLNSISLEKLAKIIETYPEKIEFYVIYAEKSKRVSSEISNNIKSKLFTFSKPQLANIESLKHFPELLKSL